MIAMGNQTVWASVWPEGLAIWRDVDAIPQAFPIPGMNATTPTNATTSTNGTSDIAPPGWQFMYAVDNATAHPIAVIGEVGCFSMARHPLNIPPFYSTPGTALTLIFRLAKRIYRPGDNPCSGILSMSGKVRLCLL
jgi:hypothetical protein